MLEYPNIDPIIFAIGPLAVRWYSMAYIAGIILGCLYADHLNRKPPVQANLKIFDDFMVWLILGIIIGGRLGFVLFYHPGFYLTHPLEILKIWEGGMSFHGGFIGVAFAIILYCRKQGVHILAFADLIACATPIGLFFGRIANFINGELYGRVTDSPIGMVFPHGGPLPRHPSQLYEAALEGLLLFVMLFILASYTKARYMYGFLTGIFISGYATARIIVEYFREPDGYIWFLTKGQALSIPMLIAGALLVIYSLMNKYQQAK